MNIMRADTHTIPHLGLSTIRTVRSHTLHTLSLNPYLLARAFLSPSSPSTLASRTSVLARTSCTPSPPSFRPRHPTTPSFASPLAERELCWDMEVIPRRRNGTRRTSRSTRPAGSSATEQGRRMILVAVSIYTKVSAGMQLGTTTSTSRPSPTSGRAATTARGGRDWDHTLGGTP